MGADDATGCELLEWEVWEEADAGLPCACALDNKLWLDLFVDEDKDELLFFAFSESEIGFTLVWPAFCKVGEGAALLADDDEFVL